MILFLLVGISAVYFLFQFAGFLGAGIGYSIFGVLWYGRYILTRPVGERPLGSPILLITIWPIGALVSMYEHIQLVAGPERYEVSYYPKVTPEGKEAENKQRQIQSNFTSLDDALKFAKKKASESGYFVYIADTASYTTNPYTGEPDYKKYMVDPSGAVEMMN